MAVTVGEVARAALADLAERSAGLANAIRWVNERVADVTTRRLKHRRRLGSLIIPAAITDGAVSVTEDSPIVTPDSTATAAWTNQNLAGRFLQFGSDSTWYRVLSNEPGRLTLEQPYQGATVSASTYHLVQRYLTLKTDAMFLGEKMQLERTGTPIVLRSQAQLNLTAPGRPWVAAYPSCFSEFSEEDGKKILEFYPYSSQDEHVLCEYWEPPTALKENDLLPTCFTQIDLKIGVLASLYEYQAAKASQDGKVELANRLSNLAARQETRWKDAKQNILRRDRATEDLLLLFGTRGTRGPLLNYNAHTEVAVRGR